MKPLASTSRNSFFSQREKREKEKRRKGEKEKGGKRAKERTKERKKGLTLEQSDQKDVSYVKTGHSPRPGTSGTVLVVPEDPTATSLDLYVVLLTRSLAGEVNTRSLVFLVFLIFP